ncbi:MAG: PAS domain S-box protein [Candidatus Hodarchaeales archaeon]|jgi:PAS domain S-box-containing protein
MSERTQYRSTDKRIKTINDNFTEIIAILHVDDEKSFLELTKTYLERLSDEKLKVDTLADPGEVFEKLTGKDYDVIVCDYQMPGTDGLQILELLRDKDDCIPFIMFTGRGSEDVAMKALNLGAVHYIVKGGDTKSQYRRLLHAIRTVVRQDRTGEALRKSEARYRMVVEDQAELICRYLPDRKVNFANEAYCRFFGKRKEEIIGKTYFDHIPEEEREIVEKYIDSLNKEKPEAMLEYHVINADGELRWLQWTDRAIFDEFNNIIEYQSVGRDITEYKMVEEALKESEEKYRLLVERVPIGIYRTTPEGKILETNPAVIKMLKCSSFEELIALDLEKGDQYHPEYPRSSFRERIERDGEIDGLESAWRAKDGSFIYVRENARVVRDETGTVLYYEGSAEDITERKLAEKELVKTKARLEYLLTSGPAVIYSCEPRDDYLTTFMSENIKELLGHEPEIFLHHPSFWVKNLHPDDRERATTIFNEISKKGYYSEVYRFKHADGTYRWMLEESKLIRDEKGNPIEIVGYWADITQRMLVEEELRKANARVTELNETLKIINSILRHDLFNDLTALTGLLDVYKTDKDEEHLKNLYTITDKSVTLIKRMRELDNIILKDEALETLDARKEILTVVDYYTTSGVEFKVEGEGLILADQAFISVIDNLVRNALVHGKTEKIEINIEDKGKYCEIRIVDQGTGIPDEVKSRIFEPGFAHGDTGGSGLGLYIVKKTMNRYDGKVLVENNTPNGSIFILDLNKPIFSS